MQKNLASAIRRRGGGGSMKATASSAADRKWTSDCGLRTLKPEELIEASCTYSRVSSSENKDNLDRQAERLVQYATAKGTVKVVMK